MTAKSELGVASVLIGFCLLNYFYLIPTQVVAEGSSPVYPTLVNTLLLLFSLAYFLEGVRAARRQAREAAEAADSPEAPARAKDPGRIWRPLAMLGVTGAWILTMEWLGFIPSTFIFLLVASWIFGSKSWGKSLALAVVMPLVVYFIFRSLNSLLPMGPLEEFIETLLG